MGLGRALLDCDELSRDAVEEMMDRAPGLFLRGDAWVSRRASLSLLVGSGGSGTAS